MKFDITRAWKDEAYRQTLSQEQLRMLPANPAGELDLTDADLHSVYGGTLPCSSSVHSFSVALCETNTFSTNTIAPVTNAGLLGNILPICVNKS